MEHVRFEIITQDKIGMTLAILSKLYEKRINLHSLEVFPKRICIKLQKMNISDKEGLKRELLSMEGVISIDDIELLSYEENEKKLLEIIDSVSVGDKYGFWEVVGGSIAIERVKKIAATVAKGNSTILLRGESGTGKEIFARGIHRLSERRDREFLAINCAALPESLLESELFGYEKGSFTGALQTGKDGLFTKANDGTIFLDEIGELSMSLQAKLLRVLQEGKIRRVGGTSEESVDVRIIAATNKNLEEMIKSNQFREDLYYRLNVIPIFIPPLRERKEDISLLVRFFIEKLNESMKKKVEGYEAGFLNGLMEYDWPGNVRELENVVERAMNLCEGKLLKTDHLIIDFNKDISRVERSILLDEDLSLDEIVAICEKQAIAEALKKSGSIRKAAKKLGVSHTTIMNKVKKYNIHWQ
ncbi:hydrogenase-4 transcriptional activator [Peptoclostridium acidaminophilum DSM 3953]|uniref:HTH-type transcriptional regulatory protein TyrR n=1 Tax=Peptoclostridium acidaminophilum DSM 3953 TaxID=1286171 RepID=W8T7K6_PEPAC|nr:sigma 54-interacting transcriptional regulator [Peptoclostridium acidaminophilum]AHM56880.1 hydrogenase-4 transcriptional activator [Peptoclostridium acidaminophilum DSM 3953]